MSTPTVFAIVVTYNGQEWLDRCIPSLLSSTVPCKVIVIDNDSKDQTLEMLRQYPQIHVENTGKNLGFGKANNIGMEMALKQGADYLLLLNQDAWITETSIERLIEVAEKNRQYGIVSPVHLNGTGSALDYKFSYYLIPKRCPGLLSDSLTGRENMKEIYETSFANAACWLIGKATIDALGGFDPLFPHYGEDTDLVHRLRFHGMKIGIVPSARAFHDRPQNGWNLYKMKPQKRFAWRYVDHLIILKNINHSLLKGISLSLVQLAIGIGKSIHRFSLLSIFGEIGAFSKAQFQLATIGKNRRQSKKKACSFLNP